MNEKLASFSHYELDSLFGDDDVVDATNMAISSWITNKAKPSKPEPKPKKAFELLDADDDDLDLIGLTMEKIAKGLKPYIINIAENVFGELGHLDFNNSKGTKLVWLDPKIADKIQERFDSIRTIEKEVDDFTQISYRKISEYEDRIRKILDTGHDLML